MIVEFIEIHACDRCKKRCDVTIIDEHEFCTSCAEAYTKKMEEFWMNADEEERR